MIVVCSACLTAIRVATDSPLTGKFSTYWPDKYICGACGERAKGFDEVDLPTNVTRQLRIRDLSDAEFFAALNGLGLPEDICCKTKTVKELLLERKICEVTGFEPSGTDRFVIEYLTLDNGDRVYLGASTYGAVVYRIAKKVSYAQRVLEEK
jgi:hypothetical protein